MNIALHTAEEARAIAAKWYERLGFPKKYDEEFRAALATAALPPQKDALTLAAEKAEGSEALIAFLYHCEELASRYRERGISEEILLATLHDLVIYCEEWSEVRGKLSFGTANWMSRHFSLKIFALGRLQFEMASLWRDFPEIGMEKGAPILSVHIPRGEKMTPEACLDSFRRARAFFAEYFPDFHYTHFTCFSWLLDASLSEFLREGSNILQFGNLFTRVHTVESLALLDYLYPIGTTKETLETVTPVNRLAAEVKDAILRGRAFYSSFGVIPADRFDK